MMSVVRWAVLILCVPATITLRADTPLSAYFTLLPPRVIDNSYSPRFLSAFTVTADLNGDGNEDFVVLGADYPPHSLGDVTPQPGRVYLGDGNGGFAPAPAAEFPVDTLKTVHPRKVLFADFNADRRVDMFISSHGWDADPFPGEQNRLYLSRPGGGWTDATDTLPQLSDYSHTSAAGDLSGRGITDLVVGNGYGGSSGVKSYALLNTGGGQFSMTRDILPVRRGEAMDFDTGHHFTGATLADLDADGLPELVITADSTSQFDKLRQTTIFWNRDGAFNQTDSTALPLPSPFTNTHIDLDAQAMDISGDGLPDLVLAGTQGAPFYDGWFIQILINQGDRSFVDDTSARVSPADASGGSVGLATHTPWAMWVKPLDFNHDGVLDFSVEFQPGAAGFSQNQPLIWLNDGRGHFAPLRVGDFVAKGNEWALGTAHLVQTRNGYSFITPQLYPGSGGLIVTGLLAAKPYQTKATPLPR